MPDATSLVNLALERMVNRQPQSEATVRGWFSMNERRLLPWARVLAAAADRMGGSIATVSPAVVVGQVLPRLAAANPDLGTWGERFRPVLELFVRIVIQTLAEDPHPAGQLPDLPTRPAERMKANVLATQVALRSERPSRSELDVLRRYTGFGGLSLEKLEGQIPADYFPDTKALVDEYYTPPEVCRAIAAAVARLSGDWDGLALEPAAGIGRFVSAFQANPVFSGLRWHAVEYSKLSALILSRLIANAIILNAPFEQWIVDNWNQLAGQFALAVTNPPYGKRGANKTIDPDRSYREEVAYAYFIRRSFDSLRRGGIGVAVVPYGFMSGRGGEHSRLREKVLKRHHLLGAFRLPSSIYPGANIVTDVSFWRARGGELPAVLEEDEAIRAGEYFATRPHHILGVERTSTRGRYEVEGDFSVLPDLEPREECTTCTTTPFRALLPQKANALDTLSPRLKVAAEIGSRVARYLDLLASAREAHQAAAADLHAELVQAIRDWQAWNKEESNNNSPNSDRELSRAANNVPALAALQSVFDESGALKEAFLARPKYQAAYTGLPTIAAQAEWLFEKQRQLRIEDLLRLRRSLGYDSDDLDGLSAGLLALGWCLDSSEDQQLLYVPAADYYSGDMRPKLERAKRLGGEVAARQVGRIRELLGSASLEDASPTLRDGWIPPGIVAAFLASLLELDEVPDLHWYRGLMKVRGLDYAELSKQPETLQIALGYINHDLNYFHPPGVEKKTDPATGEEETGQQALDRVRLAYGERLTREFRRWLGENDSQAAALLDEYSLAFRGFIAPVFSSEPLQIARWGRTIALRPHQRAAARRIIHYNGGLAALDVGVGKTLTGIAAVAYLRQIGRARRPVIIVPNTILWKWKREVVRALPDYRVVVIGAEQYAGKGGVLRSRLDERAERLKKWNEFQIGLYDVAIVSYSVFARAVLTEESLRQFVEETPPLLRDLGLKSEDLAEEIGNLTKLYQERASIKLRVDRLTREVEGAGDAAEAKSVKALATAKAALDRLDGRLARLQRISDRIASIADLSERRRAIFSESVNEWIAETNEAQNGDGIEWESLKVDLLILDEAQNMKNLWPVGRREGGVPKFLGSITEGSDRALAFAVRAFLAQREAGGSGVVLLSATPAKNSPLEFFTLLGFVDHYAWTRRGCLDPDYFIDRYLKLQLKTTLKPNGTVENRTAVVGFKNLPELRDIIFRYGEFKTAQEVGLKLPEAKRINEFIQMGEDQLGLYRTLRKEYEEIVTSREGMKEKHKLLGLLQKMALVALHPELISQPKEGWTWASAAANVKNRESPKLKRVVELIRKKPGCGHIVFCDNVAVHRWLFDLLVASGVDPSRIAVLNAERAKTALARQEIADGFNGTQPIVDEQTGLLIQEGVAPKYDIVIANAIAYEGIDLQIRTCVVYHLDLPYEPATLQQRNGRAVRQFNTQAVVEIYYLLSDKSYDAIKLTLITGKLRWMSDILQSSDRETSNPAAELDFNNDEFLLLLADDPEAAKKALAEIKLRNEEEQRQQAAFQAWLRVGQLIGKIELVESIQASEDQREQGRKDAMDIWRYLSAVPTDAWPWIDVCKIVLSGVRCATLALNDEKGRSTFRLVYEGLSLPNDSEGGAILFGNVGRGSFSYRKRAGHVWKRADYAPAKWAFVAAIPPSVFLPPALPQIVEDPWEQSLLNAIPGLRYGGTSGLGGLGLHAAPDYWSADVWQRFGDKILENLAYSTTAPVRSGETVAFDLARTSKFTDVLPPTNAGYAELLARVKAGQHKLGAVQDQAREWWGRDVPRGIADDRQIYDLSRTDGSAMRLRSEGLYRQTVVVLEEMEGRWLLALAGMPSKELNLMAFSNLEFAKLAARWLAQVFSDEKTLVLDSRKRRTVEWIQAQSDLPTLAGVLAHYEREV